jgi:hypothetical protein
MDNFAWTMGFRPHLGLVRVERDSQLRIPKQSASFSPWLGPGERWLWQDDVV